MRAEPPIPHHGDQVVTAVPAQPLDGVKTTTPDRRTGRSRATFGESPRDPNTGRFTKGSAATSRPPIGRGRLYAIKRLSRDGRYDLVAMVRDRRLSAHAALERLRSESEQPRYDVKAMIA